MREFDCTKPDEREKKLYFNKHEFVKISELAKKDPQSAILAYNNYLEKYPEDISAKTYYISTLITVNRFEEAEEEIKKLEYNLSKNALYKHEEDRANRLDNNIKLCKLKLFIYQDRKKEALDLFYSNLDDFSYLGKEIIFYFRKLRGTLNLNRREPNSYMFRQIVQYKESDFKEHIKKHMADFNENNREISISYFNPDFPLDRVIEEVKKKIPSKNKLCNGFLEEMYVFKYDQCGRDNNKLVDYFKVFTFNNSQDFITMCPSSGCENLPSDDLNYLKTKEEPKMLVKRPSQIDKFNQRYKLK